MRFVDLRRENGKTPFDTVINTGCGPNFVLNRKKYFYFMIKGQSVMFWFRFWLTFCLNSGCSYLDKVYVEIPELLISFLKYTHEILLRGTEEDVCQKCFDLLEHMLPTVINNNPIYRKKSVESVIKDRMTCCLAMAFGCALCEVFYKWLNSKREDKGGYMFYWQIPEKYLDPDFVPGELEEFIVDQWKENFTTFLGVRPEQVSWVGNLLVPPEDDLIIPDMNHKFHLPSVPENDILLWLREPEEKKKEDKIERYRWQYSVKLREYSKSIRESLWLKRMAILKVDEKRKCSNSLLSHTKHCLPEGKMSKIKHMIEKHNKKHKNNNKKVTSKISTINLHLTLHKKCSHCKVTKKGQKKYRFKRPAEADKTSDCKMCTFANLW